MRYSGKWSFLATKNENVLLATKPSSKLWNLLLQWPRGFELYMELHTVPFKTLYCALSNEKIMKYLLSIDADFSVTHKGRNLANIAWHRGDKEKEQLLNNMGVNRIQTLDDACFKSPEAMRVALMNGADPCDKDYLARPLDPVICTLLINHGAVIDPYTFHWRNLESVLKSGLNVNNYTIEGLSFILYALKNNDSKAVELCRKYGAHENLSASEEY